MILLSSGALVNVTAFPNWLKVDMGLSVPQFRSLRSYELSLVISQSKASLGLKQVISFSDFTCLLPYGGESPSAVL